MKFCFFVPVFSVSSNINGAVLVLAVITVAMVVIAIVKTTVIAAAVMVAAVVAVPPLSSFKF